MSGSALAATGAPATVPGGYFGQALVVDVGSGAAERLELPEPVVRACIGGAGLGAWLMHRLAPPGIDPLAPEAPLYSRSVVERVASERTSLVTLEASDDLRLRSAQSLHALSIRSVLAVPI